MYFIKIAISCLIVFGFAWLPLVGAYDYESALATALLGLLLVPFLGPRREACESWIKTGQWILAAVLFFICANMMLIGTACIKGELCDIYHGLQYQLWLALPSNILSALVCGYLQKITRFKAIRIGLYLFSILLDISLALLALYHWPPIVCFGQFFGYFAGSIYDESIDVIQSLAAYRLSTLMICIGLIYAQSPKPGICKRIIMPVLGILLALGWHWALAEYGIILPFGRAQAREMLWQTVSPKDGAFTVHFVPEAKTRVGLESQKSRILSDYSKDYKALESFFGARPIQPIDIWLYPDAETKGRYIGARRTSFARVWKYEIHLVQSSPGSTLARHEMAHLFATSFGNPPLMVAGGDHIPAMGWIEGFAMAAEWPVNMFDLHTWAAAILRRDDVFGQITPLGLIYGFWVMPSRVAYTLAGSFVHYLIEIYGMEKVKLLSQNMPGDFESIVDAPLDTVFAAWKNTLNSKYLNRKAVSLAPLAFGATSIWSKHCARRRAAMNDQWYDCLDSPWCSLEKLEENVFCEQNEKSQMNINKSDSVCRDSSELIQQLERLWALYMARGAIDDYPVYTFGIERYILPYFEMFKPALDEAHRISINRQVLPLQKSKWTAAQFRSEMGRVISQISWDDMPPAGRLLWSERRADMMFYAGQGTIAALMYGAILWGDVPENMARRIEIKRQAAETMISPVSQLIRAWFGQSEGINIERVALEYPDAPILSYLDFVHAMNRRAFMRARRAYVRIMMNLVNGDKATRLTPRAYRELWRLMPLM